MADLISIEQLRKDFQEKTKAKDIKEFAVAQQNLIENLLNEIKSLKEKASHLENLMKSNFKPTQALSDEEVICIEQIGILKQKSSGRILTLEETKQLDLLVRSLKLIREESTIIINHSDPSGMKESELVAIAQGPTENNS